MLMLPPGSRVFLATTCVDRRKGINGLSVLVRSQFGQDPPPSAAHHAANAAQCFSYARRVPGERASRA
jgi:hypothetical protein